VLLTGQPGIEVSSVLTLMGRAFNEMGDHKSAARCFAGQRPE